LLSSKPGAANILYLDFNGHITPNSSEWGVFRARPFTLDNNRKRFNRAEKAFIENVWRRVTEDFAPFQYDVTTVGISQDHSTQYMVALDRDEIGSHIVIVS
jgi:hypothetical protein